MNKFLVGMFTGALLVVLGFIGLRESQGIRSAKKFLECYELVFQESDTPLYMDCFLDWQMFDYEVRNTPSYGTTLDKIYIEKGLQKLEKKYKSSRDNPKDNREKTDQ